MPVDGRPVRGERVDAVGKLRLAALGTAVFCLALLMARAPVATGDDRPSDFHRSLVHLYFADRTGGYLSAEERVMTHPGDTARFAADIVRALIGGPRENLVRTLPPETRLRTLFVAEDGCCYVDLSSEGRRFHPGGVQSELLSVYSIVNSLVLNIDTVNRVKLLMDGDEVTSLAGHIDLTPSLAADMLLIR
jgi:spore germination protein GerM